MLLVNTTMTYLDGVVDKKVHVNKDIKKIDGNLVKFYSFPKGYSLSNFDTVCEDWEDLDMYLTDTTVNVLGVMTESNGRISLFKDVLVEKVNEEELFVTLIQELKETKSKYLDYFL